MVTSATESTQSLIELLAHPNIAELHIPSPGSVVIATENNARRAYQMLSPISGRDLFQLVARWRETAPDAARLIHGSHQIDDKTRINYTRPTSSPMP